MSVYYLSQIGSVLPMPIFLLISTYIYIIYLLYFLFPLYNTADSTSISIPESLITSPKTNAIYITIMLHLFIMLFLISYIRTFKVDPGKVPEYWHAMVLEELNRFDSEIQAGIYKKTSSYQSKSVDYKEEYEKGNTLERNALSETEGNLQKYEESYQLAPIALDEHKLSELEDEFLKQKGYERFCSHCQNFKPPRTHHCRECGRCVLKMDHHCPWVLNCIGFYNYKLFFNMLLYGELTISIITITFFDYIMNEVIYNEDNYENKLNLFIISSAFGMIIMIFLLLTMFFLFHCYLIINGSSNIENFDKKKNKRRYDLGIKQNLICIFGRNPFWWLLPVMVCENEDGVSFTQSK